LLRRSAIVLTAAVALQTLPSLASTGTGVVRPIVRSTLLTATDTVAQLKDERLVGVTWTTGSPTIGLRWHTRQGWGAWQLAEQDTGASPEGTPGTEPQWRPTGADRVEVRTDTPGLHLVRVTDGVVHRVLGAVADAATGRAVLGEVHSRADWGADESMRRRAPSYASKVVAVTVHHTANSNGYTRQDVPAIIRADYAYHVQTRGWNDLGYNLLVDEYGGIWEGRAGGLGRATIGAHAQGFNVGTLGVAMLGDMTTTTASHAAEKALARVIAYASSTWHFDLAGTVRMRNDGSPKFADGQVVTLPRVFGHQEAYRTDCPGSLQDRLPYLRHLAKVALGRAPQFVRATVTGAPVHAPTPAVLEGQLSLPVSWTVTFTDAYGSVLASAKGSGTNPRLSWDGFVNGLPALPGTVTWKISADDEFHPAVTKTGTFDVGLPLVGA
jgi:hypothetical protein